MNDAYNANPTSMRASLRDLVERAEGRRRVAILGEMAELGPESERYHAEIGALLDELGIELVVARRRARARLPRRRSTATSSRTRRRSTGSLAVLRPGDAILVKASRSVGLEGIPALIEKHAQAW